MMNRFEAQAYARWKEVKKIAAPSDKEIIAIAEYTDNAEGEYDPSIYVYYLDGKDIIEREVRIHYIDETELSYYQTVKAFRRHGLSVDDLDFALGINDYAEVEM